MAELNTNTKTVTKPNAPVPNLGSANAALGQGENEVLTPELADTSGGVGGKGDLINVLGDGDGETVGAEKTEFTVGGDAAKLPVDPKKKA
ncbi:MAG: hypothetical protein FWF44_05850 [Defluviitaleaceae bacterium]|nr:hypothetical protein [Defluviitaleaceae bacterium]